ncbi:MAG: hypothetical protein Q9222_001991 [Ikaeria aurantiellina]
MQDDYSMVSVGDSSDAARAILPKTTIHQRGFYFVIAALPLSFAIYKFSRSSDGSNAESAQPWLTRILRRYDNWSNSWADRNSLHTKMIEQAGHDRNLFINSPPSPLVDLSFPE